MVERGDTVPYRGCRIGFSVGRAGLNEGFSTPNKENSITHEELDALGRGDLSIVGSEELTILGSEAVQAELTDSNEQ